MNPVPYFSNKVAVPTQRLDWRNPYPAPVAGEGDM